LGDKYEAHYEEMQRKMPQIPDGQIDLHPRRRRGGPRMIQDEPIHYVPRAFLRTKQFF